MARPVGVTAVFEGTSAYGIQMQRLTKVACIHYIHLYVYIYTYTYIYIYITYINTIRNIYIYIHIQTEL